MIYVLYNPFAGNKTCKEQSRKLNLYKDGSSHSAAWRISAIRNSFQVSRVRIR